MSHEKRLVICEKDDCLRNPSSNIYVKKVPSVNDFMQEQIETNAAALNVMAGIAHPKRIVTFVKGQEEQNKIQKIGDSLNLKGIPFQARVSEYAINKDESDKLLTSICMDRRKNVLLLEQAYKSINTYLAKNETNDRENKIAILFKKYFEKYTEKIVLNAGTVSEFMRDCQLTTPQDEAVVRKMIGFNKSEPLQRENTEENSKVVYPIGKQVVTAAASHILMSEKNANFLRDNPLSKLIADIPRKLADEGYLLNVLGNHITIPKKGANEKQIMDAYLDCGGLQALLQGGKTIKTPQERANLTLEAVRWLEKEYGIVAQNPKIMEIVFDTKGGFLGVLDLNDQQDYATFISGDGEAISERLKELNQTQMYKKAA